MDVTIEEVTGWAAAIKGTRYPMDSDSQSDSTGKGENFILGPKDKELLFKLCKAGKSHRKTLRMIHIQMTVKTSLQHWSHLDTYKVGTTAISRSKMHKLGKRPFDTTDIYINPERGISASELASLQILNNVIDEYNKIPKEPEYQLEKKAKFLEMVNVVPMGLYQERMYDITLEVLANQWHDRKNHKLPEWKEYFEQIFEQQPFLKEVVLNCKEG